MNKFTAVVEISRPVNVVITFITILLAGIICSVPKGLNENIWLAALSGIFITAAGNIINDYFDIEIDKINKPDRVLPAGKLKPGSALLLYTLFSIIALFLSAQINLFAFLIIAFTCLMLFFYSYKLKKVIIMGNLVVAFFTGLAFIFGGVAVGNWQAGIFPALFAFFVNLIREIVKDAEDIKGDKLTGVITLPQKYKTETVIFILVFLTALLIVLTTFPFFLKIYNIEYFIIVMVVVNVLFVYFIREIKNNFSLQNLQKMSSLLKLNMILGLISIFIGSF
ncbi:(S)-2,3-di-O-geranylgeranylglyceryl phosphate synthase [bacterium BMS3Abin04]|nr:(S)-2,3-di-O-geranylgeranylglyceryl phosphate synthase [bacterium BMS3Abin04]